MTDNRKQIVSEFLNNERPARVPIAFWHHFVSFHDHHRGVGNPEVMDRVYAGQKDFLKAYHPDLVKIMSDGFFGHPAMTKELITTMDGIRSIAPCGADHPFIEEQVRYVKAIVDEVNGEVLTYYNIFSPLQYIRLKFEEYDEDFEKFCRLFFEDPQEMVAAAERIAADIMVLIDRLFTETNVDGIYYSVQAVQDKRADKAFHDRYVKPLDLMIMSHILKYTDNIMLHICGYGHYTNELTWYKDYPAKVFNWATHTENISLEEGKRIFDGKPVLGGFDNNSDSILYNGTHDELVAEVTRILEAAGDRGVAIGADCTISADFDPERIKWIIEAAEAYAARK